MKFSSTLVAATKPYMLGGLCNLSIAFSIFAKLFGGANPAASKTSFLYTTICVHPSTGTAAVFPSNCAILIAPGAKVLFCKEFTISSLVSTSKIPASDHGNTYCNV